MRRCLLTVLPLLLFCCSAHAQNGLTIFAESVKTNGISFDYSFEIKTSVTVKGVGNAALFGASYFVSGNGLEIHCDGKTRWSIDRASQEAYVESVDDEGMDYLSNPAMLLGSLDEMFLAESSDRSVFFGREADSYLLKPVMEGTGLESVKLFLVSSTPVGVIVKVDDGTEAVFKLSSVQDGRSKEKAWSFDPASLGKDFVITDLR